MLGWEDQPGSIARDAGRANRSCNWHSINELQYQEISRSKSQSWHAPCFPTLRALALRKFLRRSHEEAEGFLTNRIADRRGDHFDHRGHRNSELAQVQDGGQRIVRSWIGPHAQYC